MPSIWTLTLTLKNQHSQVINYNIMKEECNIFSKMHKFPHFHIFLFYLRANSFYILYISISVFIKLHSNTLPALILCIFISALNSAAATASSQEAAEFGASFSCSFIYSFCAILSSGRNTWRVVMWSKWRKVEK